MYVISVTYENLQIYWLGSFKLLLAFGANFKVLLGDLTSLGILGPWLLQHIVLNPSSRYRLVNRMEPSHQRTTNSLPNVCLGGSKFGDTVLVFFFV